MLDWGLTCPSPSPISGTPGSSRPSFLLDKVKGFSDLASLLITPPSGLQGLIFSGLYITDDLFSFLWLENHH